MCLQCLKTMFSFRAIHESYNISRVLKAKVNHSNPLTGLLQAGYTPERVELYSMSSPHAYDEYMIITGPHSYQSIHTNATYFLFRPLSTLVWIITVFLWAMLMISRQWYRGSRTIFLLPSGRD